MALSLASFLLKSMRKNCVSGLTWDSDFVEDLTKCLAVAYMLRLYLISRAVCWNMWTVESLHFGLMSHWNGNDQKCRNEPSDY